ncbi:twin-arginine translocation signal domain-containing protein [bacterium]|nr:twin-arginine translocation signal domain-containing protein [bacterium]
MMTRRQFMGALTVLTAACGSGLGGVLAYRRRLSLAEIVPAAVLPLQGVAVSLRASSGRTVRGVIEGVTAVRRPSRAGAPGTEQISLLVAGDLAESPSIRYHVETDDVNLGELDFLPVGGNGRARRLEAVITRIV